MPVVERYVSEKGVKRWTPKLPIAVVEGAGDAAAARTTPGSAGAAAGVYAGAAAATTKVKLC